MQGCNEIVAAAYMAKLMSNHSTELSRGQPFLDAFRDDQFRVDDAEDARFK